MGKEQLNNLIEIIKNYSNEQQRGITFIEQKQVYDTVTYKEFYQMVLRRLAYLQSCGLCKGDKIILQCSNNKDLALSFWACILGGMIPIPLVLAINEEQIVKLVNVWYRIGNAKILFNAEIMDILKDKFDALCEKSGIPKECVYTVSFEKEKQDPLSADKAVIFESKDDDIAFIQFSSGSTGDPKGVILTHKNLLTNIVDIVDRTKLDRNHRTLSWLPLTHDLGIIGFHLTTFYVGLHQTLMSPAIFMKDPVYWLEACSELKITHTSSPNFGYRHLLAHCDETEHDWDLSSIEVIFNGAEQIDVELTQKFLNRMAEYNLNPNSMYTVYGLAEATLGVTMPEVGTGLQYINVSRNRQKFGKKIELCENEQVNGIKLVSNGFAVNRTQLRIVDDDGNVLSDWYLGNIELRGDSITKGFYNSPEKTETTIGKDGWLKTGDIGFVVDGNLYINGRKKDMIILNGVNYYSSDIERVCEEYKPGKYIAAAVYNEKFDCEDLAIFVNYENSLEEFVGLMNGINNYLWLKCGVKAYRVIPITDVSRTNSGKTQRFVYAERYRNGDFNDVIEKINSISANIVRHTVDVVEYKGTTAGIFIEALLDEIGIESVCYEDSFSELGLDSVKVASIASKIQKSGKNINIGDFYVCSTVAELLERLEKVQSEKSDQAPFEYIVKKSTVSNMGENEIAITGISLHLPSADNLDDLAAILSGGLECVGELSQERKKDILSYLAYMDKADNVKMKIAAYLERIDSFDEEFFRITPTEANLMNPVQRMVMQSAYEAIEDAGYNFDTIKGSYTGVYVGNINIDSHKYKEMILDTQDTDLIDISVTGNLDSIIPSRISQYLDLKGPCLLIDTACSSSLVALHEACKAIICGDCDQAIISSCSINIFPIEDGVHIGMESDSGQVRTFDSKADGTVTGEGVISIFVKPLKAAIDAGDDIYAIIKGSAINHDGNTLGITAPNADSQCAVLQKAWANSNIDPEQIECYEAHGTATRLGDVIEMEGLTKAFSKYTSLKQFCAIGSIKSNIGHLYQAAGLAGVAKLIIQLKNKTLLPTANFEYPNSNINFEDSPVYICTKERKWETKYAKRTCAVSAFGFSGTNCHVVMQENVEEERKFSGGPLVLALSARNDELFRKTLQRYLAFFSKCDKKCIDDICYSVDVFKPVYSERICFVFRDVEWLLESIRRCLAENTDTRLFVQKECEDAYNCIVAAKNFVNGENENFAKLFSNSDVRKIHVPVYPLSDNRHWIKIPYVHRNRKVGMYELTWKENNAFDAINGNYVWVCSDKSDHPGDKILTFNDFGEIIDNDNNIELLKHSDTFVFMVPDHDSTDSESLFDGQKQILNALKCLFDILEKYRKGMDTYVVTVSRCGQVVFSEDIRPENSTVHGVALCMSLEYSRIFCRGLDIDDNVTIDALINEASRNINEPKTVCLRDGKRYTGELRPITENKAFYNEKYFNKNKTYLVTGGTGALGGELVRFMSDEGCNVAIIGRRKKENVLYILNDLGLDQNRVAYYSCDIASQDSLNSVVKMIEADFGTINGVVHTAGVAAKGLSISKSIEESAAVLQPKIQGTYNLLHEFNGKELDFFVMYSSDMTLLGEYGQGDYVMANSYLDAVCMKRYPNINRMLTINLPLISGGIGERNKYSNAALEPIDKFDTISIFINALATDKRHIYAGNPNKDYDLKNVDKLFSIDIKNIISNGNFDSQVNEYTEQTYLDDSQDEIIDRIRSLCSNLLGIEMIDIDDNLMEKGADSIMFTKIHEGINNWYPNIISIPMLLANTSIRTISECIFEQIHGKSSEYDNNFTSVNASNDKEELLKMIDQVSSGEKSIDDILSKL